MDPSATSKLQESLLSSANELKVQRGTLDDFRIRHWVLSELWSIFTTFLIYVAEISMEAFLAYSLLTQKTEGDDTPWGAYLIFTFIALPAVMRFLTQLRAKNVGEAILELLFLRMWILFLKRICVLIQVLRRYDWETFEEIRREHLFSSFKFYSSSSMIKLYQSWYQSMPNAMICMYFWLTTHESLWFYATLLAWVSYAAGVLTLVPSLSLKYVEFFIQLANIIGRQTIVVIAAIQLFDIVIYAFQANIIVWFAISIYAKKAIFLLPGIGSFFGYPLTFVHRTDVELDQVFFLRVFTVYRGIELCCGTFLALRHLWETPEFNYVDPEHVCLLTGLAIAIIFETYLASTVFRSDKKTEDLSQTLEESLEKGTPLPNVKTFYGYTISYSGYYEGMFLLKGDKPICFGEGVLYSADNTVEKKIWEGEMEKTRSKTIF